MKSSWCIFTVFLLAAGHSSAFVSDLPAPKLCQKDFEKKLKLHSTSEPWIRIADPDSLTKSFRQPQGPFGRWTEVVIPEGGAPSLALYSSDYVETIVWDSHCKSKKQKLKLEQLPAVYLPAEREANVFRDADLESLVRGKKNALIYLWSPRFVYSVLQMNSVARIAKAKNLEFIPLLDPQVSLREARAALEKVEKSENRKLASLPVKIQKMNSSELYLRSQFLHFPYSFVVLNGKISSMELIGAMPEETLAQYFDQMILDKGISGGTK